MRPHPLFTREGADLHCEVPISIVQAALGAEIEVPTLEGKVTLRVPEGTQSGKVMRLRGKGLPTLRSGDARRPATCASSSRCRRGSPPRQRELLERFAEELAARRCRP